MKTIWKFTLNPASPTVQMPAESEVLSAGVQGDDIQIWALVDPQKPLVVRDFHVFGTGHEINPTLELSFISTVFMGPFVFHVFESYFAKTI